MIRVDYRKSTYRLIVSNLLNSSDDVMMFKFDTGAIRTIISIETLLDDVELKKLGKDNIRAEFENRFKSYVKSSFKSASGNDMYGYLCKANDVLIDETELCAQTKGG